MIELVTPEAVDGEENLVYIELFSIDGKVYTIPDRAKPIVANQYLYIARKQGVGIAESWLAEELLGKEAYEALLAFPALTQAQMNQIITTARAVVFGEIRPKAQKSGRASKTAPRKASPTTRSTSGSQTRKKP